MASYLIIGAGLMGTGLIHDLLTSSEENEVIVIDIDAENLATVKERFSKEGSRMKTFQVNLQEREKMIDLLNQVDCMIGAASYTFNYYLSELAIETKTHFCDLGGNNTVVQKQLTLNEKAKDAGVVILPDCGLAPGLATVLAAEGMNIFDEVDSIHIRVGGLPDNPKPPLNYKLVFSVQGLINEYVEPCLIIKNGKIETVEPLTEIEELSFEGFGELEAFQTSGGTSSMPHNYLGKVKDLTYKTVRYKGHCHIMKAMLDLGFAEEKEIMVKGQKIEVRSFFESVLDESLIDDDSKDLVLLRAEIVGTRNGKDFLKVFEMVDRHDEETGITAMMRTTSYPTSIMAQLIVQGKVEPGARPIELCIPSREVIDQLPLRKMHLKETMTELLF
ncbi:MAG: saccharopine dehydrogenase C-terminal domain-containing protein [Candidatus Kariarchaeaceae archaeon]